MSDPTVVLVHGMGCNAASWTPVVRELALRGHRVLAVDLPGHGFSARVPRGYLGPQDPAALAAEPSGMQGIGTADDVAAVVDVLRRAREHGPTVLVGVSRGGLTLTAVGNAAPDLVDRLVYVSAHCPVQAGPAEYDASPENAESLLGSVTGLICADPAAVGGLRLNWRTADPAMLDALQAALLADGTRDELLAYLHTQDPDETLLIDEDRVRADAATWGRIPRSYVRLTADRALPPALQDRYIAEADALTPDNPFDVHEIATSHLGVQVHPEPLADVLHTILTR
ncbi:alpha/beta fold hydrolase [Pseudonocardia halophobica]|uniref:alpha/beta fold hydrolase n=1 Tax=Pseudonocardia halophobica TaxID=29401 RepID=UPI003D922DCA